MPADTRVGLQVLGEADFMDNRLQIEQAAQGCVSGTLKEWPALDAALSSIGWKLKKSTPASYLRDLCQRILGQK